MSAFVQGQVILVGDPQQLPPTVMSGSAGDALKLSLFERLTKGGHPATMCASLSRTHHAAVVNVRCEVIGKQKIRFPFCTTLFRAYPARYKPFRCTEASCTSSRLYSNLMAFTRAFPLFETDSRHCQDFQATSSHLTRSYHVLAG